jgi:hypothetical protein
LREKILQTGYPLRSKVISTAPMKRMPVKSVVVNLPEQKTAEQKARECQARIEIERERERSNAREL